MTKRPCPNPSHPEYRVTLIWRNEDNGNGTVVHIEAFDPVEEPKFLQASFHPTLDLHEALESAMTSFFERNQTQS